MVTLTLLQGVLNTFVFFFSHVIGRIIDSALRGERDERRGYGIGQYIATMVAQLVLGALAALIVAAFSRWREYRADRGGANLAGRAKMIAALRRLGAEQQTPLPDSLAAFGISGGGLVGLFRSHPPIEQRIAALQAEGQQGARVSASV